MIKNKVRIKKSKDCLVIYYKTLVIEVFDADSSKREKDVAYEIARFLERLTRINEI